MIQCDNTVLNAYDMTYLKFKSRYSKLTISTIEFATNDWIKQIFFRRFVCIKEHLKLDKKAYNQTCNTCDWKVSSFMEISKYIKEYQEILKLFSVYYYPSNSKMIKIKYQLIQLLLVKSMTPPNYLNNQ